MTENRAQIEYDGVIDAEVEENKLFDDNKKVEDEILREFNADDAEQEWIIKVKKTDERTKKQDTCFIITPDELNLVFERLKNEYGPGVYRAYVTCNGVLRRNLEYRIAKPLSQPVAPQNTSQISDIATLLTQQNQQMMDFIRNQNSPPASDPMAMFTAMMGAISQMKNVFAAPQSGGNNSIETLIQGIELADKLRGSDGKETNMIDGLVSLVNSDVGKAAVEQIKIAQETPKKPSTGALPQTNPVAEIAPAVEPRNDVPIPVGLRALPPEFVQQIAQQVAFWMTKARKGSSAELYAELALDTNSPDQLEIVLSRPDLKEIIVFFEPDAETYWPWFEALRSAVYDMLTDDADEAQNMVNEADIEPPNDAHKQPGPPATLNPDENSGGQGGRGGDAGNHETASTSGKNQRASTSDGGQSN